MVPRKHKIHKAKDEYSSESHYKPIKAEEIQTPYRNQSSEFFNPGRDLIDYISGKSYSYLTSFQEKPVSPNPPTSFSSESYINSFVQNQAFAVPEYGYLSAHHYAPPVKSQPQMQQYQGYPHNSLSHPFASNYDIHDHYQRAPVSDFETRYQNSDFTKFGQTTEGYSSYRPPKLEDATKCQSQYVPSDIETGQGGDNMLNSGKYIYNNQPQEDIPVQEPYNLIAPVNQNVQLMELLKRSPLNNMRIKPEETSPQKEKINDMFSKIFQMNK